MKLPRRRERVRVDIDPVQLVAVNHLLRFGPAQIEVLFEEVSNTRGVVREMFDSAMAGLAAQGVVDYRFRPEDGVTLLALTELGGRLRGRAPADARSALAIYL